MWVLRGKISSRDPLSGSVRLRRAADHNEAGLATMTGVEAGRQWPCSQSLGTCAQFGRILKYFWRFWLGFPSDKASFISYLLITSKRELIWPLHCRDLRPYLPFPSATISALVSATQTVISTPTTEHKGVVCLIFRKRDAIILITDFLFSSSLNDIAVSIAPEQSAQQPSGHLAHFGSAQEKTVQNYSRQSQQQQQYECGRRQSDWGGNVGHPQGNNNNGTLKDPNGAGGQGAVDGGAADGGKNGLTPAPSADTAAAAAGDEQNVAPGAGAAADAQIPGAGATGGAC